MSVTDILKNTTETLFSFEVLPPLRGKSIDQIYGAIDRLIPFNPAFIEVTTHRSDFTYKEVAPGQYKRVEERLRPGTVAIAYAIKQKYELPVVPHIICSGYSQQETEYELLDLAFLDLRDLIILRGDKSKQDSRFIPKEGGLRYASELCEQVNHFNEGKLLFGEDHELCKERPFTYGVAGYPGVVFYSLCRSCGFADGQLQDAPLQHHYRLLHQPHRGRPHERPRRHYHLHCC